MKRVSWSNVFAVLLALYVGRCSALEGQELEIRTTQDTVMVFGLKEFTPSAVHLLVFAQMAACAESETLTGREIVWATARRIVLAPDGTLFGGYWFENPRLLVVLDGYKWDASYFGHEALHAVSGLGHGEPGAEALFERCGLR